MMKKRSYRSLALCAAVLFTLGALAMLCCLASPPAWSFTVDPPVLPDAANNPGGSGAPQAAPSPESPSVAPTISRTVLPPANPGSAGTGTETSAVVAPGAPAPSASPGAPAAPTPARGSFVLVVSVLVVVGLLAGLYLMNRNNS